MSEKAQSVVKNAFDLPTYQVKNRGKMSGDTDSTVPVGDKWQLKN